MKNTILFLFLVSLIACNSNRYIKNCSQYSEPIVAFNTEYIKTHSAYFTFDESNITGAGQEVLKSIAKTSQFVMIGERHGSSQTSKLVSAWLPQLAKNGFDNFACEVGPSSAKVLQKLATPAAQTTAKLNVFNKRYYFEQFDDVSLPFFSGIEDAQFLKVASENGMDLWGLDQEYYYAILHLTEELTNLLQPRANYKEALSIKAEADKAIMEWFIEDDESEEEVDVFGGILADEKVSKLFQLFTKNDIEAQSIIESLEISFDIYTRWRRGSHADRISYMRNNFMEYYNSKTTGDKQPKVFLKFGQLHASKLISNGAYDLGNLIQELACSTGKQATNIAVANRFYEEEGEVVDYLNERPWYFGRLKPFLSLGKMDQAVIINLKAIRSDIKKGMVNLPSNGDFHALKSLIFGYDYQIILPLDRDATPNF